MTTRIAILVEGATEVVFKSALLSYLQRQLEGKMPKLDFVPRDGRIATADRLKRQVELLLRENDAMIALTDVYTGSTPPEFVNADDAKNKMRQWVGPEPRFHPHAAQYEFETWLLAYWPRILQLAGSDRNPPALHPETVNHNKPPARHLSEVFRTRTKRRPYSKALVAQKILRDQDLAISAACCPELQAFLDMILSLSTA